MSFFKKLTDEFKELKANFDDNGKDKDKKDGEVKPEKTANEGTRDGGSGPPPYGGDASYNQHQYGAPHSQYGQGYNNPPPQQAYGQPPQPQQAYGQPPQPQQAYGQAPPPSGPPGQPQLPPGWISQWDHNSQRYYYVEQATGRTQWDAPQNYSYSSPPPPSQGGYAPPPTGPGGYHEQSRGEASGFYNQYGGAMPAQGYNNPQHQQNAQQYYGDVAQTEKKAEKDKSKKDKDHSTRNMLLAGAGGLAVGGLAVAAFDSDSDDEHKAAPVATPAVAPSYPGYGYAAAPAAAAYGADPSYGGYPPAAPLPAGDESDREDLIEAQQDYNEAAAAAADSDASSSDLEELQEAREDYEEAAEDYYED